MLRGCENNTCADPVPVGLSLGLKFELDKYCRLRTFERSVKESGNIRTRLELFLDGSS